MLYNDLIRINSIDQQITNHLKNLLVLYEERAKLVDGPATAKKPKEPTLEEIYDQLQAKWAALGTKIPSLKSLQARLQVAQDTIKAALAEPHPVDMSIVLVPPTKLLLKAMNHANAPAIDIMSFTELSLKPSIVWQCAVVQNPSARLSVENVHNFLHTRMPQQNKFDKLDTSAQVVTAAYLQGVSLVEKGTWNLLIANMVTTHEIPCAQLIADTLQFSLDDSEGFLGQNYYYPSLIVKG